MKRIWLDAGHGGSDPGACNGSHHEADYALDITLRLGKVLEEKGYAVLYSRRSNATIPLSARSDDANKAKVDIFVSVHCNSAANASANGIETLVYKKGGEAEKLAKAVQNELITATGARDRGVKEQNVHVCRETVMPAILVEAQFISNSKEVTALSTPEHRKNLAEAIARGVCTYLGEEEKGAELTSINDIVWELGHRGLCEDTKGMMAEMEEAPNGRLYWIARKCVNYMREKGI